MKKEDLPKIIPVFPLSNFIIFPKTTVPLNIFEPRYIDMINDSMKSNKLIGIIQPVSSNNQNNLPKLHNVGCLGKITSFRETEDGRFLIELKGLIRFNKKDFLLAGWVSSDQYNNQINFELPGLLMAIQNHSVWVDNSSSFPIFSIDEYNDNISKSKTLNFKLFSISNKLINNSLKFALSSEKTGYEFGRSNSTLLSLTINSFSDNKKLVTPENLSFRFDKF